MSKGTKIGIGVGVAVVLLVGIGMVGYVANENLTINEEAQVNPLTNSIEQIETEEISNEGIENLSDQKTATISGISYTVTRIAVSKSWPSAGLWEKSQGEYMLVYLDVKNISNEAKTELKSSDFFLIDSVDRRYDGIMYRALLHGDSWGTLQPGLGGERGLFFLFPYENDLDYTLMIKDETIQLGDGQDFDVVE